MTLLFQRAVAGPATHAFVVGVGNFPYAAGGPIPFLHDVPNLPSAADSAKMMADWLLANQDTLAAPLASLEVLISDPPNAANRYPWAPGMAIDTATPAKVEVAGYRWLDNFPAGSKNTAFFYGCGHGASLTAQPALFLEELNRRAGTPWPNIDAAGLALALRVHPHVDTAYVLIDACGQKVADFETTPPANRAPTVFYSAGIYGMPATNKVMMSTAAPEGQLAYDAPLSASYHQPPLAGVPIGRFTQALLMALNGSSVRPFGNRWAVDPTELHGDVVRMKKFYFPHLIDYPFDPTQLYRINESRPFVFPARPTVPYIATTNPNDKIDLYELCIRDMPPPLPPTDAGIKHDPGRKAWFGVLPPRKTSVFAVAFNANSFFTDPFTPDQPRLDVQIEIR